MSVLLETTVGDIVVDLDIHKSPELCKNFLKLTKCRYYTNTLIYNVEPTRYCQLGDPRGDGTGGACLWGVMEHTSDVTKSHKRFMKSKGRLLSRDEKRECGRVVAVEMKGVKDTIGSQFLITLTHGQEQALDGLVNNDGSPTEFLSLGTVVEDEDHVLDKIRNAYCDGNGRPYADIRIIRALVIEDPFEDPPGMQELMEQRGVLVSSDNGKVVASPEYERPPEEVVEHRIQANQVEVEDEEETVEKQREREEEMKRRETKSRAVVLEMLGDLPSADVKAPENVLFVCKLNPVTEDEDLELIFSRFDPHVKAEIIRDPQTGNSLHYAFVEFSNKQQCVEGYFKMNNALVDDRRIKVDFSQSVAKVWDKYAQKKKRIGSGGKRVAAASGGQKSNLHGGSRTDGARQHGARGRGQPHHHHDQRTWPTHRGDYRESYRQDRRGPPPPPPHGDRERDGGNSGRGHWGRHDDYNQGDRYDEFGRATGRRQYEGNDRHRRHDDRHSHERGLHGSGRRHEERSRGGWNHCGHSRESEDGRDHKRRRRRSSSRSEDGRPRSRSRSPPSDSRSSSASSSKRSRKRHKKHRRHKSSSHKHDRKRSRKHRRHDSDDEEHHRRHKKHKHGRHHDERRHKKRRRSRSRSASHEA